MSFSHMNIRQSDEQEYFEAFLTMKNGKRMSRCNTCKAVSLQLPLFSTPIKLERIIMCSITPIMQLIARLLSFFEKKLLKSEKIVVSLPMVLDFELYCFVAIKLLNSNELSKSQDHFLYENFVFYAGAMHLRKFSKGYSYIYLILL